MAATTRETPPRRRADATRNDERIDDIAIQTLSTNPAAGMDEIAKAAGVGRTTLHRRYQTREALIAALRVRARRDLRNVLRASRLDQDSATEALDRLLENLASQVGIYRFLARNPSPTGHHSDKIVAKELGNLICRGQHEGSFTTTNPPEWWVEVIQALLVIAIDPPAAARDIDTRNLIRATLAGGLIKH